MHAVFSCLCEKICHKIPVIIITGPLVNSKHIPLPLRPPPPLLLPRLQINKRLRYLARKNASIFVRGHFLFRELSFDEQIMSKYKYPSIFSPQMEAIVFIFLQIFFATRTVLKIGECSRIFPSFSWGNIRSGDVFRPIASKLKYLMDYKTYQPSQY